VVSQPTTREEQYEADQQRERDVEQELDDRPPGALPRFPYLVLLTMVTFGAALLAAGCVG
jgi:hypothetical protein